MMMRRMTALLMAALLMLSLASCGTMNSKKGMGDKGSAGSMEPAMTDKQDMDGKDAMMDKDMDGKDAMMDKDMGGKDAMMDKDMGGEDAMMDKEGMDSAEGDMMHFPAFEGMDLEGNAVKSDELFGGSAATVVNFWFTTCGPCVGELSELDALNRELSEKGAALIGINAFTLGGDKTAIADAKDVLAKKGATYRNVYFDADSEAGMFASDVYAFPTTYVVDRNGAIVGGPIVGALTEQKQMDALQELVDQAVAMDAKHMG
ncbi:TlpA disulfide reductase family protein [uncultured Pseudoflavonifractor sp.]|uniref:TlpA disulfide reductase family protein n=1 Tax=uncultured Pseudoflavonifractor sp. TaxID=1221379 RepID=UPI0025F3FAD0|nr:TlpA disulfide reductase family protein [uncultured Pseudoflavonifractor sp.]